MALPQLFVQPASTTNLPLSNTHQSSSAIGPCTCAFCQHNPQAVEKPTEPDNRYRRSPTISTAISNASAPTSLVLSPPARISYPETSSDTSGVIPTHQPVHYTASTSGLPGIVQLHQSGYPTYQPPHITTMPKSNSRDHDTTTVENASDSEHERATRTGRYQDDIVRQAPYLPRVQVWAREGGPYTLRVGHQWFHCDELMVNGVEYRDNDRARTRKPASESASNQAVYPPRRPVSGRKPSYQRQRPETESTSQAQSRYGPQALPTPREQAARWTERKERQASPQAQAQPDDYFVPRPRRDSGVGINGHSNSSSDASLAAANVGALVTYEPPTASRSERPAQPTRRPSGGQGKAMRQAYAAGRPGRLSRGNSYQTGMGMPVKRKGKSVRFAPLPKEG